MILLDKKDSVIEDRVNTVVTIGNFDGIHLGHQQLINKCIEISKKENFKTVVLSFYPHPRKILNNDFVFNTIITQSEKTDFLLKLNVDYFRRKPIDKEFLNYTSREFVENVLVKELSAKAVVVGADFHFSSNRGANTDMLRKICSEYGIETVVLELKQENNEKIGSTRVRNFILQGDFENVTKLLGRNYSISGYVVDGKKLGRTIGVPTANVFPEEEKLLPPNGVYISKININGDVYNSITNIGSNPTLNEKKLVVETFIIDFDKDIYGEYVTIEFLSFIRREQKFNGIVELKNQLHRDIDVAKEYFSN